MNTSKQEISVEPFPLEVFPPPVRRMVEDASRSINCNIEFVGAGALVCASVAIGKNSVIRIKKGWKEGAVLFMVIVAEPGQKKTPALTTVLYPLYEKQKEFGGLYKKWKEEGSVGDPPEEKAIITTDVTMEAIGDMLSKNPHGVLLFKDELVGWFKSMNQYKGGKGDDTEKYLSIWSQVMVIIDRKSARTIQIDRPFLSILGGIQNDLLNNVALTQGNGLPDRLLWNFPSPIPAIHSEHEIDEKVMEDYVKIIHAIYDKQVGEEIKEFPFNEDAQVLWKEWHTDFCTYLNSPTIPYYMRGALLKLEAYVARFSLILEHLKCANDGVDVKAVSKESLEGAIKLYLYFKSHATKLYDSLTSTPLEKQIIRAIHWLSRKQNGTSTLRRFYTNRAAGVKNAQEAIDLLEEMKARGLCSLEGTGEKSSTVYIFLNPKLLAQLNPNQNGKQ